VRVEASFSQKQPVTEIKLKSANWRKHVWDHLLFFLTASMVIQLQSTCKFSWIISFYFLAKIWLVAIKLRLRSLVFSISYLLNLLKNILSRSCYNLSIASRCIIFASLNSDLSRLEKFFNICGFLTSYTLAIKLFVSARLATKLKEITKHCELIISRIKNSEFIDLFFCLYFFV